MKCHAIRIHEIGGPEVMKWEEVEVPDPGPGQIRLKHTAVGLNYIDVYFRSGTYPAGEPPFTTGLEGAGVVEAVGEGVTTCKEGDRVAYASPPLGSYAEARLMPAEKVVNIPNGVSDEQAAAMMLKGMTTEYLLSRTYPVKAGETILFHAAAGGVGLIACQWAKAIGATVIGTVGSPEKAELAKAHGCDYPILYDTEDLPARVKEITGGEMVPVVYDSVGKSTFMKSINCLRPRGFMVSFGQSSGSLDPVDPGLLSAGGSLYLTRPGLMTYTSNRQELEESSGALFDMVSSGKVKIEIHNRYALSDAVQAHKDLEGRKTTGSTVLQP